MSVRAKLALIGLAATVAGCGDAADDPTKAAIQNIVAAGEAPEDCLVVVWDQRKSAADFGGDEEREFDRANDQVEGGAISCATATSASQFEATIRAIRESASDGDRAELLKQTGIPLIFIDEEGNPRELESLDRIEDAFDDIFSEATIERLRTLELDQMTVVPNEGGYFDLGALWLVVTEPGGRPKLVTVNRRAAREAVESAARNGAERE